MTRDLTAGWRTTPHEFGCADTIEIEGPSFYEISKDAERSILALVYVNRLCGPICGEQYVVEFSREDGEWMPKTKGLVSSGIAF